MSAIPLLEPAQPAVQMIDQQDGLAFWRRIDGSSVPSQRHGRTGKGSEGIQAPDDRFDVGPITGVLRILL
ncbi:hypothetical protein [Rhizobium leguminosarum]|uniref:hypothetical protein n=1 Tax=Rhizobium leguminosarum TaxID=384 RepID=UPI001FDFB74D|nr:hypothetical protein [Rhizobium leguminosarum]